MVSNCPLFCSNEGEPAEVPQEPEVVEVSQEPEVVEVSQDPEVVEVPPPHRRRKKGC